MLIKRAFLLLFLFLIIFFGYKFFTREKREFNLEAEKQIILNDNGLFFTLNTQTKTIADALQENKIILGEYDQTIPEKDSLIFSGIKIQIRRAVKIKILVDGQTIENYTLASDIRSAILENNIAIGRLDKSEPDFNALPTNNLKITLTRINVEEKIIPEDIEFKTINKNDDKLGWREKKS